ncbi:MAG: amino acid ABC transporter ATP-binding protein [Kofleriaceae bacterium]
MIRIRALCKRHGDHRVLSGVSATVERGELIAIVGPSGGGKTTLLRCLNYLEDFDEGEIDIAGFALRPGRPGLRGANAAGRRMLRELRAAVGMVFQQLHLFAHLTALENVALAPQLVRGVPRAAAHDRARELLAQVGLAERAAAYPHQLSGGQQQRVAIARALAGDPTVLLFDEPTSALDPELRDEAMEVMRDLAARGMTMLVVTHEMQLVAKLASRVWIVDQGTLVEDGPAAEVVAAPQSQVGRDYFARLR